MPYPNEHAARINDPKKYKRIRRMNNKLGPGVHAIFGFMEEKEVAGAGGGELQAIRFDRTKFTPKQAKKWLEEHEYKVALEEATEKEPATVKKSGAWFARWHVTR
jgi:hypothetical protein